MDNNFTNKEFFYGQIHCFLDYAKENNFLEKYNKTENDFEEIFYGFYFNQKPNFLEALDLINLKTHYNNIIRGEIDYMEDLR